jgi:hypothetical protein
MDKNPLPLGREMQEQNSLTSWQNKHPLRPQEPGLGESAVLHPDSSAWLEQWLFQGPDCKTAGHRRHLQADCIPLFVESHVEHLP